MSTRLALVALMLALAPVCASAELVLPPGFVVHPYVTGDGFEGGVAQGVRGIPTVTAAVVDRTGVLYLSRSGRRYFTGEIDDIFSVYRFPAGGAQLTPATEPRHLYGPPLPNPQVASVRGAHELLVTTFDRDRRVGVLYRLVDGRADLVAGGSPPPGQTPVLRQPEGVAVDAGGHVFVADREQGRVVKLAPSGRILDAQWFAVTRPRILAIEETGWLWVAADGAAEAPWQRGPGEIWRVSADGRAERVVQGPVAAGMVLGPAGTVFVSDRHAAKILMITSDGRQHEFGRFTDGDAPRAIAFVPDTPEARRAGIAGDLLVVRITRGAWRVNDVVRITGPFGAYVAERLTR